jgi:hypothetical protein
MVFWLHSDGGVNKMPCTRLLSCANPNPGPADSVTYAGNIYWLCNTHQSDFDAVFKNQGACTAGQREDAKKLFITTSSKPLFDLCMMALVEESAKRHGNALTWR